MLKLTTIASLLGMVLLSGCGQDDTVRETAGGHRHGTLDPAIIAQAKNILSTKCAMCHSFANNPQQMIDAGLIVGGNANTSPVYLRIKSGSMPPGAPLTAADASIIAAWIDVALEPTHVPTQVPTNAPTNAPTSAPTSAPTKVPTVVPTMTALPTAVPTTVPTTAPTMTALPTSTPLPTGAPTFAPTFAPTMTALPTSTSTFTATATSTFVPTVAPTVVPTSIPSSVPMPTQTPASGFTYYNHIKAILDAKCAGCHQPGGVEHVLLDDWDHVGPAYRLVGAYVAAKKMPPGQSTIEASPLLDKRTFLTKDEQAAILAWVNDGGPAGNPSGPGTSPAPISTLPRVDASVKLPQPYTPTDGDDYQTFTLPWTVNGDRYVTGFESIPGPTVHHILIFSGSPGNGALKIGLPIKVGEYRLRGFRSVMPHLPELIFKFLTGGLNLDDNGDGGGSIATMSLIGAFVPGIGAQLFPAGMGIKVAKGSSITLQMHYNSHREPGDPAPVADQTQVNFMLASSVPTVAKLMPIVNPIWMIQPEKMRIPAGSPDTVHSAVVDPFQIFDEFTKASSLRVFSTIAHMHLHGKRAAINVLNGNRRVSNLLYVPSYDFQFQMNYQYAQPVTLTRGQMLEGVCQWDNKNQPILNGQPLPTQDITWGERTTDEMCLFGVYIAK